MNHLLPLELEGFPYDPPPWGGLKIRSFSTQSAQQQFDNFADRVASAVAREYLPIYRMADGEFALMVGPQTDNPFKRLWRTLRGIHRRTMWAESYTRAHLAEARGRLGDSLRRVAGDGVIAPYFVIRPDQWGVEFLKPVNAWLQGNGVYLHEDNYTPFYTVYALLAGLRRGDLYEGRKILIATHTTPEREAAIRRGLEAEGVARVEFLPISAHAALLEEVDLTRIQNDNDIAIVAGGIGSVNIIDQLRPLRIPCIDAGIALECWIDSDRRFDRPFLVATDRATAEQVAQRRKF